MKHCDSCQEQPARYRLSLTNMQGEVLDTTALCLDCLTTVKVLDVLTPGAVDTGEPPNVS